MTVYRDPLLKCNNPGGNCYWGEVGPIYTKYTVIIHKSTQIDMELGYANFDHTYTYIYIYKYVY